NGKLDWVTWEELANRRAWRAFEWSPDGGHLVFLRLNQSAVPEYPLVDAMELHPKLTRQRYPKARDPNPTPAVLLAGVGSPTNDERRTTKDQPPTSGPPSHQFTNSPPRSSLVLRRSSFVGGYAAPDLTWTPDSRAVAWTWLARNQRSLELRLM